MSQEPSEQNKTGRGGGGDSGAAWGWRLFVGTVLAVLAFFWWLLIYSGGVVVHHG